MSLSGHVSELALGDLLQVTAMHRRTCCIEIDDPLASGEIYFEGGEVTHAHFGELTGNEAVYALLARESARFELRTGVRTDTRTVSACFQELLLESARLRDEGLLIEPTPRRRSSLAPLLHGARQAVFRDWARQPRAVFLLTLTALLLLAGLAWLSISPDAVAHEPLADGRAMQDALMPRAAASELDLSTGVQGAELVQPGDEAPMLLTGGIADAPATGGALLPTIVCRVLVGTDGNVQRVEVVRPRDQLAAFEAVAVDTVRGFTFRPARRGGELTAAWVNVPVPFRSRGLSAQKSVRIKGSDTIGGALGPALGEVYRKQRGVQVHVEALGSSTAFVGLLDGTADIGAASRPISSEELQRAEELGLELQEFAIGYDGIAVIVHPDNPLREVDMPRLAAVFRGELRDWSELSGAMRGPIHVLSRPSYSGTHGFFKERVLSVGSAKDKAVFASATTTIEKNEDLVATVQTDPLAIAYVGLGWSQRGVRSLAIVESGKAPVAPDLDSVRDGTYPIYRPLLFYTRGRPRGEVALFLRFVFSPAGQALVQRYGFVGSDAPVALPSAAEQQVPADRGPDVLRVYFESGSVHLDKIARLELERALPALREGELHAVVVGAADAKGDPKDNAALADRRAERVVQHLVEHGVDPRDVRWEPGGESRPLASNDSTDGRRVNRRVDVYLAAK